ncbi:hypothetical protein GCM10022280_14820 [Sphingomonas swuensis]|uniref:Uncharacterized protein n=1 Tax=Sphingomonas swuensis TaxID=977800 RepID=A0ABP7SUQ3_9SPHN
MTLLAALAFTAVLAVAMSVLAETIGLNWRKIAAALEGQSFLAEPVMVTRPVRVRMVSRPVSRPLTARPQLRAAA